MAAPKSIKDTLTLLLHDKRLLEDFREISKPFVKTIYDELYIYIIFLLLYSILLFLLLLTILGILIRIISVPNNFLTKIYNE
jgi:hypothetical protein